MVLRLIDFITCVNLVSVVVVLQSAGRLVPLVAAIESLSGVPASWMLLHWGVFSHLWAVVNSTAALVVYWMSGWCGCMPGWCRWLDDLDDMSWIKATEGS